jgi:hypothetical protein
MHVKKFIIKRDLQDQLKITFSSIYVISLDV